MLTSAYVLLHHLTAKFLKCIPLSSLQTFSYRYSEILSRKSLMENVLAVTHLLIISSLEGFFGKFSLINVTEFFTRALVIMFGLCAQSAEGGVQHCSCALFKTVISIFWFFKNKCVFPKEKKNQSSSKESIYLLIMQPNWSFCCANKASPRTSLHLLLTTFSQGFSVKSWQTDRTYGCLHLLMLHEKRPSEAGLTLSSRLQIAN